MEDTVEFSVPSSSVAELEKQDLEDGMQNKGPVEEKEEDLEMKDDFISLSSIGKVKDKLTHSLKSAFAAPQQGMIDAFGKVFSVLQSQNRT